MYSCDDYKLSIIALFSKPKYNTEWRIKNIKALSS